MTKKKILKIVGTDVDELKNIVGGVFDDKFQEQKDIEKKKEHINKLLKKDELKQKLNEQNIDAKIEKINEPIVTEVKEPVINKHSCPSCQSKFKKVADNFEVCEGCGTIDMTIKKGQKLLICDKCGGIIPESFVGTGQNCPHCGSTGAHWAK